MATTGVPEGESLYWSATGDVDANDFESAGLTGSATVSEAGTVVVDHAIKADDLTEGDETMEISFYSDSDRTQQVGESVSTRLMIRQKNMETLMHVLIKVFKAMRTVW